MANAPYEVQASQFNIDRTYPGRWTISFNNPPINMFVPSTIVELGALMTDLEADPSVKVVVFQSANPDFFIAHLDVSKAAERPEAPSLWPAICGISALKARVSGAGLCSPFSNFRLAVAETGSIADRDRFAECPSGIRRTPTRVPGIDRLFVRAMRILSRKAVFLVACLLQAISPPRPMTPALIAGATMRVQPSPPARPTNRAGPWRGR